MSVGTGDAIVYAISVVVMLFFTGLGAYVWYKTKHIAVKSGCLIGCYLLIMIMSYFTWVTAGSMTESAFIDLFFKWMFLIMMYGFIPLIIGSFIYTIYMMITIAPFKRMLERGTISDEALENRIKRSLGKR